MGLCVSQLHVKSFDSLAVKHPTSPNNPTINPTISARPSISETQSSHSPSSHPFTYDSHTERALNRSINSALKREQTLAESLTKLLLLGTGNSGKSTLFKQMKILYSGGFAAHDRQRYSEIIRANLHQSVVQLLDICARAHCEADSEELQRAIERLRAVKSFKTIVQTQPNNQSLIVTQSHNQSEMQSNSQSNKSNASPCNDSTILSEQSTTQQSQWYTHNQLISDIDLFYHSQACKTAIEHSMRQSNKYPLFENAAYFLANHQQILQSSYQPSNHDILCSRFATTGIHDEIFEVNDAFEPVTQSHHDPTVKPSIKQSIKQTISPTRRFKLIDVGGQLSERSKWCHCFESVDCVMFVASINDFDQTCDEDASLNRLIDCLNVFEGILSLPWFKQTSMILFLNKSDLFEKKIKHVKMSEYFPEFERAYDHDYDECLEFIKESFFGCNNDPMKLIYAHVTNATDTQQIEFVWKATQEIIVRRNLKKAGLMDEELF